MLLMRLELCGDDQGRVEGFLEKPKTDAEMNMVASSPEWIDSRGIPSHGRDLPGQHGHLSLQS